MIEQITCPACGGKHIWGYVFRHDRECAIKTAEDRTQFDDITKLKSRRYMPFVRPMRDHEFTLLLAFHPDTVKGEWLRDDNGTVVGIAPDNAEELDVVRVWAITPPMRGRVIAGFDPEADAETVPGLKYPYRIKESNE